MSRNRRLTAEVRQELRRQIDAPLQLATVLELVGRLETGSETLRDPGTGTPRQLPLTSERVAAIAKAIDVRLRLLNKVVPDLKAVEVTGEDGAPLSQDGLDDRVLATKLRALWRAHDAAEGELVIEQVEFLR